MDRVVLAHHCFSPCGFVCCPESSSFDGLPKSTPSNLQCAQSNEDCKLFSYIDLVVNLSRHISPSLLIYYSYHSCHQLSAALCCWLIIGRKQSRAQIFALFLLLISALVIEKIISLDAFLGSNDGENAAASDSPTALEPRHFTHGVVPILVASGISGLAGAITQKSLQSASGCGKSGGKNAVLFSAELCVASLIMLGGSLTMGNADGQCIRDKGFFADWTPLTVFPILTNALGGIFVGLVTKYAGSVRKGFALIFGLLISGLIQAVTEPTEDGSFAISREEIIGGCLASISLWIHITNPYMYKAAESASDGETVAANASISKLAVPPSQKIKTRKSRRSRKED